MNQDFSNPNMYAALRVMSQIQCSNGSDFYPWSSAYSLMQSSRTLYDIFRPCLYTVFVSSARIDKLCQLFWMLERHGWDFQVNQGVGWVELARIEDLDYNHLREFPSPRGRVKRFFRVKWKSVLDEAEARVAHWWCQNIFVGLERTAFSIIGVPRFDLLVEHSEKSRWYQRMTMKEREVSGRELEKSRYSQQQKILDYRAKDGCTLLEEFGFCFEDEDENTVDNNFLFSTLMYTFCAMDMNVSLIYGKHSGVVDPQVPDWFNFGLKIFWNAQDLVWSGVLNFKEFHAALSTSALYQPFYRKISAAHSPLTPWKILCEVPINIFRELYEAPSPFLFPPNDVSLGFFQKKYLFDSFIRHNLRLGKIPPGSLGCWPTASFPTFESISGGTLNTVLWSLALYDTDDEIIDYASCAPIHVEALHKCYNLTPLQLAICFNDVDLAQFLIESGCDVNYFYHHKENVRQVCENQVRSVSPLEFAIILRNFDLILLLLKNENIRLVKNGRPLIHELFSGGPMTSGFETSLTMVAQALVDRGVDLFECDSNGNNLLHTMLEKLYCHENIYECLSWFFRVVSEEKAGWFVSQLNNLNETVFASFFYNSRYRCMEHHLKNAEQIMEMMLNALPSSVKSDILNQEIDSYGSTILNLVYSSQFPDSTQIVLTRMLLEHGARLFEIPWDNLCPEMVELYLDHGHDPMFYQHTTFHPRGGEAPFFDCAVYGTFPMFQAFLSHPRVNVNARNARGLTVSFFLVQFYIRSLHIIRDDDVRDLLYRLELLIKAGADVSLKCCPEITEIPGTPCTALDLVKEIIDAWRMAAREVQGGEKRSRVDSVTFRNNYNLDNPVICYLEEICLLLERS